MQEPNQDQDIAYKQDPRDRWRYLIDFQKPGKVLLSFPNDEVYEIEVSGGNASLRRGFRLKEGNGEESQRGKPDETWQQLGVGKFVFGDREIYPLQVSDTAQGTSFIKLSLDTLLSMSLAFVTFISIPNLEVRGLQEGDRTVTEVIAPEVKVIGTAPLSPGERVEPTSSSSLTLEQVKPPVGLEQWVSASGAESWVRNEVQRHLAQNDTWHNFVAAGLMARLAIPSGTTWQIAEIQEDLAKPRRWIRSLDQEQRMTVEILLAAEVQRLFISLDELHREMACDDPGWQADLVQFCQERDDLEGVRILLNETESGLRMDYVVEAFDSSASKFVRGIPVVLTLHDERLQSVASFDPEAWWVSIIDRG
jgi:hypothetical protein